MFAHIAAQFHYVPFILSLSSFYKILYLTVTLRTLFKICHQETSATKTPTFMCHGQLTSILTYPWGIPLIISSACYLARVAEHSSRCPERLGCLHPSIYSELSLMWLWVTWSNLRAALLWAQGWTRDPQRSFLTHRTICFYFHVKSFYSHPNINLNLSLMNSYTQNLLCSPLPKDFTIVQLNEITLENKLPNERMTPGFSLINNIASHRTFHLSPYFKLFCPSKLVFTVKVN